MYKIIAYTDGACSGNPGPMGAGALILTDGTTFKAGKIKQISQSLGAGTNNVAELQAISLALSAIFEEKRSDTHITIRTDSQYCIGVLSKNHKISANITIILCIKDLMREFDRVDFEKITAHNGDKYNEWANNLAQQAVRGNTVDTYV